MAEGGGNSELYSVVKKPTKPKVPPKVPPKPLNRRLSGKPPPAGVKGEIRAVLIGRTGEGKSATANTIFNGKIFVSEARGNSVTARCDYHTAKVKGRLLCIIDTPGLFDTHMSNDDVKKGISDYLALTSPGPHVFLIVIKIARFTKELGETYETVCELFGNEIHRFSIVVLTGADDLEHDGKTVEEYLGNAPDNLKQIIKNSGDRYVAINNRARGPQREKQVDYLLETMDNLIRTNCSCFSSETYISVEKILQQLENRDAIIREKEMEANNLKKELQKIKESNKTEIEEYEFRARTTTLEREKEKAHREKQYADLEREFKTKLRDTEDKYEKQLREARDQIRSDIQTKKIDTSESWFKGQIREAGNKLKSMLGL